MFTLPKIPQNIQAPFGLLGNDPKLSFRTQPSGISKLSESTPISPADVYWEQFWHLFDTPSDVFTLITPHDIRSALSQNPLNVATLIRVLCTKLFTLVSDHTFPSGSPSVVSSLISSSRNTTKEALNCLRVLSRVFPVIFELESDVFEQEVLWKQQVVRQESEISTGQEAQFVIADDDDEDEPRDTRSPSSETPRVSVGPSLAEKLLACLLDLLFCCGFTLPSKIQLDHYKISYTIWEKGVGSTVDTGSSHNIDLNKIEVLRFLLVLISRSIYVPSSSLLSTPSKFTAHLIQKTPRRQVLTLLCSLLNTCMHSGSSGFAIPYNHLVWKGEDVRASLVGISFQVLCALIDYQSETARDKETSPGEFSPTSKTNAFRYSVAKLHRPADFEFILNGIAGILEHQISSLNNLLPGSKKPVPYLLESSGVHLILLWNMIELNPKFLSYFLESEVSTDVVVHLLCIAIENKDKPQNHGLSRALSYIIETLSAEHLFGCKMADTVKPRISSKSMVPGNVADFMIHSVSTIVATSSGQLNSLLPALIIALVNVAPYFQNLSTSSATRLVQLLKLFSSPSFLLSDEGHPRLLYFLLEIFNAIIFHHLQENPNVVYCVLRSHQVFEDLGTFTLPRALREIRRIQLAKEQLSKAQPRNQGGKTPSPPPQDPGLEKARLLESEGVESPSRRGSVDSLTLSRRESISGMDPSLQALTTEGAQSPSLDETQLPGQQSRLSEKARGKRPERSLSLDAGMNESLERIAQSGVGRNGFVPTQEWVTSWQQGLPLDPVMLMISELLPKVQGLQNASNSVNATPNILSFLRSANLSRVLPSAPPVNPRRFQWTETSLVWLSSLIWGEIYVRGMSPYGIWSSTNVRLFHVKHAQAQTRQISEAVSTVVGGLGGLVLGSRNSDGTGGARARTAR